MMKSFIYGLDVLIFSCPRLYLQYFLSKRLNDFYHIHSEHIRVCRRLSYILTPLGNNKTVVPRRLYLSTVLEDFRLYFLLFKNMPHCSFKLFVVRYMCSVSSCFKSKMSLTS